MTLGLVLAAGLFIACAIAGEVNALWIPALVALAIAAGNAVS